jgi:hypothetical protein
VFLGIEQKIPITGEARERRRPRKKTTALRVFMISTLLTTRSWGITPAATSARFDDFLLKPELCGSHNPPHS